MYRHGCVALAAIACVAAPLCANAQDNFFVNASGGKAWFDVSGLDKDSAATQNLSIGYRWQAGPVVQVGVEAGAGRIGKVGGYDYDYYGYYGSAAEVRVKTSYATLGVNARFQFGRDGSWFAIVRTGFMNYRQEDIRQNYFAGSSGSKTSFHNSDNGGYAGVGIGVDITRNLNISVMLNDYFFASNPYVDGHYNAAVATANLELRF